MKPEEALTPPSDAVAELPGLSRDGDVFVLHLGAGENRFHPEWLAAVNAALDEVEHAAGPRALVTEASGKFYSNGLDLDWLSAHADQHEDYLVAVHHVFARLLSMPVITVTAIQGHAFAAGAMFTLSHDFRVMRSDRGFWCLPEVDINMPFTSGMASLLQARMAPQAAHEAMLTGHRYGGDAAYNVGIVDHAVPEEEVASTAREIAAAHTAKAGETLSAIKATMYAPALKILRQTTT